MGFSNTKGFVKEENSKTKEILQGSNDCQQAREDLGCAERKIVTRGCCCCVGCVGFDSTTTTTREEEAERTRRNRFATDTSAVPEKKGSKKLEHNVFQN